MKAALDWILNELLQVAHDKNYWTIGTILFVLLVLPSLWALWVRYFLLRKIEDLYIARIADKDKEIERLCQQVKTQQNHLLKMKR